MRRVATIGAALATAALSGCLGGSTEPVVVIGKYTLQSVNSMPLPFTFSNTVTVKSETLVLNADGSYTDDAVRSDGTVASDRGSYTNYAGTLVLFDQTINLVYQGRVEGTTLTTTVGQYTERFTRTP